MYYEKEQKEDGSIEHRHYVGGSILITSVGSAPSTITATKYWHKDHLGSNVAITDAAGVVIERMAYDPFGKRRTTGGAYDQNGTLRGANTDRGFTGHEHLDDLGFIHMNGRIFDPTLGRFLSADPYIQYADNLQSYNRYSYLMNNPLNATDPTGYKGVLSRINSARKRLDSWSMKSTMEMRHYDPFSNYIDHAMMRSEKLRMVGQVAAAVMDGVFCGGACSVIYAGYLTAIAGGSPSDVMKGMAVAYASQVFFNMAGDLTSGMSVGMQIGARAVAGCASAELGGGNCGQGAMSAAVAAGISVGLNSLYNGQIPFQVDFPATVISGGITTKLGGGKFANGALSAAFGYVLRGAMTSTSRPSSAEPPAPERNIELAFACMDACVLEGAALITVGEALVGTGAAVGIAAYWDKFTAWVGGVYDGLIYAKPPADAYDTNGPKAPGKPGADVGFKDPKSGENWVRNPNGSGYGWEHRNGDVWVPTGPDMGNRGVAHGGPHWDVQKPSGRHENVFPLNR